MPFYGFSAYASGAYTKSTIDDDMVAGVTPTETFYATAGKYFPDTPKGMAALSLQYATGPYLINLAGKFTSRRFLTLVNDLSISALHDVRPQRRLPDPDPREHRPEERGAAPEHQQPGQQALPAGQLGQRIDDRHQRGGQPFRLRRRTRASPA